jgi:hypothetical protein
MSGCDTLIVESGHYYDVVVPLAGNAGNVGSSGCYTTIEAATTWGVIVDASTQPADSQNSTLMVGYGIGYFAVYGIKFAGNPANTVGADVVFIQGTGVNHIKIQKTAGYNASCASLFTSATASASTSSTNLVITAVSGDPITVGENVIGSGLNVGIMSQTSGPVGGTGTYVISSAQSFAGGAVTVSPNYNVGVYVVGNGASNVLIEDSYAWGCGRYKFTAYQGSDIIFRHDVARHDYAGIGNENVGVPGVSIQSACFVQYTAGPVLMQNDICLDSGVSGNLTGIVWGGIWVPDDNTWNNSGNYEGDIILNSWFGTGAAIDDPELTGDSSGGVGTRIVSNTAIINTNGGYFGDRENPPEYTANLLLDHLTEVNIYGPSTNSHANGVGTMDMSNTNFTQQLTENSVIEDANAFGLANYMTSNYNIFWSNAANFGTVSYLFPVPSPGTNDIQGTNPQLKYPVRVESGTPGYGTASDGGNVGATILYRIGTPGTMWGDMGYDTLTSISLWPWSDEGTIKTDMASFSMVNPVYGGTINGARGFAATGNGLYGGPITLTSYIWESLGNPCPEGICP